MSDEIKTITLPDGYNDHTEIFYTDPVDSNAACVKLRCASPGREHMIRWVLRADYEQAQREGE